MTHHRASCGLTSSGMRHPYTVVTVWLTTGGVKKLLKRPSLFSLLSLQTPESLRVTPGRVGHRDAERPIQAHTAVRVHQGAHGGRRHVQNLGGQALPGILSAVFSLPSELSLIHVGSARLCLCRTRGSRGTDLKRPVLP